MLKLCFIGQKKRRVVFCINKQVDLFVCDVTQMYKYKVEHFFHNKQKHELTLNTLLIILEQLSSYLHRMYKQEVVLCGAHHHLRDTPTGFSNRRGLFLRTFELVGLHMAESGGM